MLSKLQKLFIIFIFSILLTSCATPLKKSELQSINTIGVYNGFDENPRYMIIGSTIFTNSVSNFSGAEYKSYLSNYAKTQLEKLGYKVNLVTDEDSREFDLLIKLRPSSVYQAEYLQGYGVSERYFFGDSLGTSAYISIAVDPYVNGKRYGFMRIYTTDKFTSVGFDHLAETWEQLQTDKQEKVKAALLLAIEQAVTDVFTQAGL